jgi:hypothetical protein
MLTGVARGFATSGADTRWAVSLAMLHALPLSTVKG